MTESFSPRLMPLAARPSAKSRTSAQYCAHVHVCQMPRSFSRIAGRAVRSRALRSTKRGSVVSASGAMPTRALPCVAEVRLDHAGIHAHVLRSALGDLRRSEERRVGKEGGLV